MSVEFDRESPGKLDSRTLNRETLNRWTGRTTLDFIQCNITYYDTTHMIYYITILYDIINNIIIISLSLSLSLSVYIYI